jgi:hypothetical protein
VVNFIINLLVSFLFPIELYSLRPLITFIIFPGACTSSYDATTMIKNDEDDNVYDHHHRRDDNGGKYVTTGTVPVLNISSISSSYNSSICCRVCGRSQEKLLLWKLLLSRYQFNFSICCRPSLLLQFQHLFRACWRYQSQLFAIQVMLLLHLISDIEAPSIRPSK